MYLSCLLIDTGNDPDRPRPARLWLRKLYRVHQRLSMAFPSKQSQAADPFFLQPYDPGNLTQNLRSEERRSTARGFLFRVDPRSDGRAVILVQSAIMPDWDYAFQNTQFLAAKPESRPFDPQFQPAAKLRFRLLANPTKKVGSASKPERTDPNRSDPLPRKRLDGSRVPVPGQKLESWLERHAAPSGFRLLQIDSLVAGYVFSGKDNDNGARVRFRSVRYDGLLAVEDPTLFRETVIQGIGPAKAFGFGLLSVAPL